MILYIFYDYGQMTDDGMFTGICIIVLNMVASTELGHTLVSILENLRRGGKDDTDKVGALEDRSRQAHDGLLAQKLLGKDNIVADILELCNIDRNHDIHGTLGDNDLETRHLGEDVCAQLGIGLELHTCIMVEAGVRVVENIGKGGLDQRVGAQDQLRQRVQALANLGGKDILAVMDKDPADSPTRDQVLLGQTTHSQHGDGGRQGGQGEELVAREDQVAVDLIRNHGQVVAFTDSQKVQEVLLAENGSARVRWVVHDDGGGAVVDQGLQLLQIHLPVVLGLYAYLK